MLTDLQLQLVKEASSFPLMRQPPWRARAQPLTRQDSGRQAASGRDMEEPPVGGPLRVLRGPGLGHLGFIQELLGGRMGSSSGCLGSLFLTAEGRRVSFLGLL